MLRAEGQGSADLVRALVQNDRHVRGRSRLVVASQLVQRTAQSRKRSVCRARPLVAATGRNVYFPRRLRGASWSC